jgi:hypothetical protein
MQTCKAKKKKKGYLVTDSKGSIAIVGNAVRKLTKA